MDFNAVTETVDMQWSHKTECTWITYVTFIHDVYLFIFCFIIILFIYLFIASFSVFHHTTSSQIFSPDKYGLI